MQKFFYILLTLLIAVISCAMYVALHSLPEHDPATGFSLIFMSTGFIVIIYFVPKFFIDLRDNRADHEHYAELKEELTATKPHELNNFFCGMSAYYSVRTCEKIYVNDNVGWVYVITLWRESYMLREKVKIFIEIYHKKVVSLGPQRCKKMQLYILTNPVPAVACHHTTQRSDLFDTAPIFGAPVEHLAFQDIR